MWHTLELEITTNLIITAEELRLGCSLFHPLFNLYLRNWKGRYQYMGIPINNHFLVTVSGADDQLLIQNLFELQFIMKRLYKKVGITGYFTNS